MFKGVYFGMKDDNGNKIREGDFLHVWQDEWTEEEHEHVQVKWMGEDGYPAFDIPDSNLCGESNGLSLINANIAHCLVLKEVTINDVFLGISE